MGEFAQTCAISGLPTCGPQFGVWKVQEEIYKSFSDIAKNVKKEQEKMYQTLGPDE